MSEMVATHRAGWMASDGTWHWKDCYSSEEANAWVRGASIIQIQVLTPVTYEAVEEEMRRQGMIE